MQNLVSAARRGMTALAFATSAILAASPANALLSQSWNGWRWARTGNLEITLGNNVSAQWTPYLSAAADMWSASPVIDFRMAAGQTNAQACGAVYGTVQACSANYGATGWLGYATVWTAGTYIVKATVKLNDYYYAQPKYNNDAWRMMTVCQELAHTLGLDHADVNRGNANKGTCMDYTNDPTGTRGTNGTLANTAANATDLKALAAIYQTADKTQLPFTRPGYRTAAAMAVEGFNFEEISIAVPESRTWAMMVLGFGAVGMTLRRRPRRAPAVHA